MAQLPGVMKTITTFGVLSVLLRICAQCFQMDCNKTLPWSISREYHATFLHDRLEELLRCPEGHHGCSASPVECAEKLYAVTCNCKRNCAVYGSCCWDAEVHEQPTARAICTLRNIANKFAGEFYAVSGCNRNWPKDEVRASCENVTSEHDSFFFMPVTTQRQVTYFNAFCALCNYDLDSTSMFWNASGNSTLDLAVSPPQYLMDNKDVFFWPCDSALVDVDACPEGSDAETTRRCSTYFAPVMQKRGNPEKNTSEVVYKNAYCGLCNGANLSSLKCVPKQAVRQLWDREDFHIEDPDVETLITSVVHETSCFVSKRGKCYIKVPQYFVSNSTVDINETTNLGDNTTTSEDAYAVRSYLTTICISLSLICLFLKGVVFVCCKCSRTFSSCCTMCLAGTLFWTHLLYLVVNRFDEFRPYCTVFAALLHFGFLSTFFWTSVLSFDIWKNVVTVRISSNKRTRLAAYCLIAWGGPMVVVVLGIALDNVASDFALSPNYGRFSCWIDSTWNQIVFLLMPMAIMLVFVISLYVHIVVYVRRIARRAAAFDFKAGDSRSNMTLFIKLGLIMGLTWLLAFGLQVPAPKEIVHEEGSWKCSSGISTISAKGVHMKNLLTLCVDAMVEVADKNSDWLLSRREFQSFMRPSYHPPVKSCPLEDRYYKDGDEIMIDCSNWPPSQEK
ncbi:hypothetical protein HPB50_002803 [Hyalomma asiaticum]|uniref:Uncharacterized protein n=1 Tax=Hyalomma asiaticum TaxID=266040 RepID=A0ACB7S4N6_HYAAI|nr:hypothetical protein HPB50_002803 [Hyalomma asiaticum]